MALYVTPNPLYDTANKAGIALVNLNEGFVNVLSGEHMHVIDPYLDNDPSVIRLRTTLGRKVAVGTINQLDLLELDLFDARQLATDTTITLEKAAERIATEPGWHPMRRRLLAAALTAGCVQPGKPSEVILGSDGIGYRAMMDEKPVRVGLLGMKSGRRVWMEPLSIKGAAPYKVSFTGHSDVYESKELALCGVACLGALVAEDVSATKGYVPRKSRGHDKSFCHNER